MFIFGRLFSARLQKNRNGKTKNEKKEHLKTKTKSQAKKEDTQEERTVVLNRFDITVVAEDSDFIVNARVLMH